MSQFSYQLSRHLEVTYDDFEAFVMAAMRKADTANAALLRVAFPALWKELQERHDAPGGRIGDEEAVHTYRFQ